MFEQPCGLFSVSYSRALRPLPPSCKSTWWYSIAVGFSPLLLSLPSGFGKSGLESEPVFCRCERGRLTPRRFNAGILYGKEEDVGMDKSAPLT